MARGILSIIIGGVMVAGGLSGQLVLRGTGSGGGLAAVGALVIGIGVYRIVRAKNAEGGEAPPPPRDPPNPPNP